MTAPEDHDADWTGPIGSTSDRRGQSPACIAQANFALGDRSRPLRESIMRQLRTVRKAISPRPRDSAMTESCAAVAPREEPRTMIFLAWVLRLVVYFLQFALRSAPLAMSLKRPLQLRPSHACRQRA